jgi:enamine deaminase RidA (YjgF/YER057c/UK114 family)
MAGLVAITPERFPWYAYRGYTFSLGLRLGGRSWLSGHTGSAHDPAEGRMVVRGGMAEQARTAWAKVAAILEAAGQSPADVVRVVEYLTERGLERYAEAAAVRAEVLGAARPAVNTVVVRSLLRPEALLEIEVTADTRRDADDLVYLPSILPVDGAGEVVGPGDVVAQTRAVWERARALLAPLGLGLDRVVKTLDYVTPAALGDYKATGRVRRELLGPVYPAAAGIIMPSLPRPGALIQVDAIASRHEPHAVNPGWARYAKLTYSAGVRAGRTLFLSGFAALDPETERPVHAGDVVAQAEYTYTNVLAVLRAAGAGPEHLIKTIEYVTPAALARYRDVAAVRARLLRAPYPASTGCVCEALLRPEFEIEIDPTAVLD